MKLEKLVAINAAAAAAAAQALGRMTHRRTAVKLLNARLIRLSEDCPDIDRKKALVGVYLAITGGLQGAALLCFTEPKARALIDMVVGSPGESVRPPELDHSAIMEVGNIICGNYVTEFSNRLDVKVTPSVPQLARGAFREICAKVVALHGRGAATALLLDVVLELPEGITMSHFLLCFETDLLIEA